MSNFAIDYCILVFAASLGVIQLSASLGNLSGILLTKSRILTKFLGIILMAASFMWFFLSDTRNINDYMGGLDANQQALIFVPSALGALIFTFVTSTIINAQMKSLDGLDCNGFEALQHTNYGKALLHSVKYWRTKCRR